MVSASLPDHRICVGSDTNKEVSFATKRHSQHLPFLHRAVESHTEREEEG